MDPLIEKYQHICFSGAGADRQNGFSERGIQTIIGMACTILIHSDMCIPQGTITAELWTMTIYHVVWMYN